MDGIQTWSYSNNPYPQFPTINITSSEDDTIYLWILISTSQKSQPMPDNSFYKEQQYTTPLILPPNTSIDVYYTVAQIIYGKLVWYKLIPGMYMVLFQLSLRGCLGYFMTDAILDDFADAVPFNSSMSLYWNNRQIYAELELETGLKAALQALGTVGGIFSFADGIFALIFGRTMLALLTGKSAPLL
jgi:hypothetical protein